MTDASDTYLKRYSEIGVLLENLQRNLKKHAVDFKSDPGNWGFIGDLGHIKEVLTSLGDFVK